MAQVGIFKNLQSKNSRFFKKLISFTQAYCTARGTTLKSELDQDDIDYFYNEIIKKVEKRYLFQEEWIETFWTSIKVNEFYCTVGCVIVQVIGYGVTLSLAYGAI